MVDGEQPVSCSEEDLNEREHLRPRGKRFEDLRSEQVMKDIRSPLTPGTVVDGVGRYDIQKANIARLAFDPLDPASRKD